MAYRKTPKVKKQLDEREKAILKAARVALAEKSYQGASIKGIAKMAGIATGTFYLYFRNKEALFNAIVDEMYGELLTAIEEERAKYDDVLDKLKASMEICIKLFLQEESMAKILLIQIPQANSLFNNLLAEIEDELIELTKSDLDEALESGKLPKQDTLVSATAFVGSFRQVIINWLRKGEPANLETAFETLMEYSFKGLGVEK